MAWQMVVWHWLANAAVGSLVVLGIGGVAVWLCRQPVQRLRVIALTLAGCLILPWLSLLPALPHYSVGVLSSPQTVDQSPVSQPILPEASSVAGGAPALPQLRPVEVAADAQPVEVPATVPDPLPDAPTPVAAAPAVAPQQAAMLPALPTPAEIVLVYPGMVALLFAWWLLGVSKLLYLHWIARPASGEIVELFREIEGPEAEQVQLLTSDRISLPLTSQRNSTEPASFAWLVNTALRSD